MTLPFRRRGIIYSPRLGSMRVHVTINPEPPAAPLEVFVDVDYGEGSVLVGLGHSLARVASLALQAGTPIGEVIRAWRSVAGQPGDVTDADGIARAESLPDLVAQVLEQHMKEVR